MQPVRAELTLQVSGGRQAQVAGSRPQLAQLIAAARLVDQRHGRAPCR